MENIEIESQENSLTLGKRTGTYRIKFGPAYFLPHVGMFLVAGLGFLLFQGAQAGWQTYVSAVVFAFLSLPFLYMAWRTVPTWFDELTIYEKGFAYRGRRVLQICTWDEIDDLTEILDLGNRLKMTSVCKTNGENITFAFRMRGLDVLSYEYHLESVRRENDGAVSEELDLPDETRDFGELRNTYRIRFGVVNLLPLGAVLFLVFFGVLIFVSSGETLSLFICVLPVSVIFVFLLRSEILSMRDELQIFENGFAYIHRGKKEDCLWDEIEDYDLHRSGSLTSIKKDGGAWIGFANAMQGIDELKPHLKKIIKWTGPEA